LHVLTAVNGEVGAGYEGGLVRARHFERRCILGKVSGVGPIKPRPQPERLADSPSPSAYSASATLECFAMCLDVLTNFIEAIMNIRTVEVIGAGGFGLKRRTDIFPRFSAARQESFAN